MEFIEAKSQTVNIISDSWFEDGDRADQKCEEPGPDWKQYDVQVLSRASKNPFRDLI